MKLLVLTILILFFPLQQTPIADREEADVVVLKFSWSKLRQNSDLIHGVDDPGPPMNEPIAIKPPERKNEPQEVKNRRDMAERRADMDAAMDNAQKSSAPRRPDQYFLHLEVKNSGTNTIKNMVWEYQPAVQTADYEPRQYVCSMKAKPNESKTFELVSPSPPVKVVSADKKAKEGTVVINRIEYADGSVWKRKGWSILIPPERFQELRNGQCFMF
jgi:hypothetical protein